MTNILLRDYSLEASLGLISGRDTVNKFGEATDCDSGVLTDIWDGADGVTSTDIWVPPTAARIHTLVSTSLADSDSGGVNPQSTGARTVRVSYLADWDTAEATEDVTLDGTTGVAMTNAAVIIHRMQCLTWGAGGVNAGVITATAATDATITACIAAGYNQTQMCIYGVPSTQKLRMWYAKCEIIKGLGGTADLNGQMLMMIDPATNVANNTAWTNKENITVSESIGPWEHDYKVPKKFDGPCIVKFQVSTNTNNTNVIGAFDADLVDN